MVRAVSSKTARYVFVALVAYLLASPLQVEAVPGGIPTLEERVTAAEAAITNVQSQVTTLQTAVVDVLTQAKQYTDQEVATALAAAKAYADQKVAAALAAAKAYADAQVVIEAAARQAADASLQSSIGGLATPGTLNNPANPIDWSQLKGVPSGFADGIDNDTTYSGANFATSNQNCAGSQFAKGISATGGLNCATPGRGVLSSSQVQASVTVCGMFDPTCPTSSNSGLATATCAQGSVVTGGGFSFNNIGRIEYSRKAGNGWEVSALNHDAVYGGTLIAYATCLTLN